MSIQTTIPLTRPTTGKWPTKKVIDNGSIIDDIFLFLNKNNGKIRKRDVPSHINLT